MSCVLAFPICFLHCSCVDIDQLGMAWLLQASFRDATVFIDNCCHEMSNLHSLDHGKHCESVRQKSKHDLSVP